MRFQFIAKHRGVWPVRWICEVLDVSPSGFYDWLRRPPSRRARYDEALIKDIRRSFHDSDQTYGVRRVWPDLQDWGHEVGRERVRRLMRFLGLVARSRRHRKPVDKGLRLESAIAPNTLNRDFKASGPDQKWVADFTYIKTGQGWLFVAVVLDLFSRRIVGWSMKARMTADLVADALLMAIWRRRPENGLLHHSDQGSQYSCEMFQQLLADHGIECSMSRQGECHDNAVMESFFSRMKDERTERKRYRNRDEARADVFDYIELFYNPRRRHSSLGWLSPVEFEKRAKQA